MKLELIKETKPNGDIFYNIRVDEFYCKCFWAGNPILGEHATYDGITGPDVALTKAKEFYNKIKAGGQPETIFETIQSEEIPTP